MNEQELLPCPFCGGEAIHRPEDSPSPGYWIRCTQCHAESDDRSSRETAAKTWNSRAATMPTTHPHSSPLEQVTDDWRLMPKEPTKQMVQAACDATFGPSPLTSEEAHRLGYAAMILVAPTPPAPQAEGEIERLRLRLDYEWGINDEYITRFSSDEQKLICAALRSAQAPTTPIEIEQLLKNAGLTSRDGTFVSAPTREIVEALRSAQAPAEAPTWDCATCHDDPRECAKIPMRHCEKLQRDTASAARTYADEIEDGWRLIETAPTDGQHILLSTDYDPPAWVSEGYYDEDKKGWWSANTHWTDAYDGQIFPTHWQPLPSPPRALATKPAGEEP